MRWIGPLIVFLASAVLAHLAVVNAVPSLIMKTAMDRLAEGGVELHTFRLSAPTTPDTQTIVRPSPDLAYSVCRFDLSQGPVQIEGAPWDGYASLSIFDARTDNVFVTSLDLGEDKPRGVVLALEGSGEVPETGLPILWLDQPLGLALIRRLAPTPETYDLVREISLGDMCQRI